MSVTVRFAPSPTGKLHVGNVRTALINWLYAKSHGGKFLLRIDDTDLERSTKAFEAAIKADLSWLGLKWDDTFNQSARFADYAAAAKSLRDQELLYACYETPDELERKRKIALSRGRPPVYDRAALDLTDEEKADLEAAGRKPHWRFKLSGDRVTWTDLVRGDQAIETSSLSDPILIREDGSYLYTLPSVVDDIAYGITHVVRGEDHVTNSGAQIEIFEALGGTAPEMAHTPLLVGADGSALSKRLGSLSMDQLRTSGVEPLAIASFLAKLGTSDNVEIGDSLDALAEAFSFSKIGRAPARFDEDDLRGLNATYIHELPFEAVKDRLTALDPRMARDPKFWETVRANCATIGEARDWVEIVYGDIEPVVEAEDREFIAEAAKLLPDLEFGEGAWRAWTDALKAETGRKGKGLFKPLRLVLTGKQHGPDMAGILALMGRERAASRLAD